VSKHWRNNIMKFCRLNSKIRTFSLLPKLNTVIILTPKLNLECMRLSTQQNERYRPQCSRWYVPPLSYVVCASFPFSHERETLPPLLPLRGRLMQHLFSTRLFYRIVIFSDSEDTHFPNLDFSAFSSSGILASICPLLVLITIRGRALSSSN